MKNLFLKFAIVLICFMGFSHSVFAISQETKSTPVAKSSWLTTSAAQRAHNDVQIRRLKNLFAEKQLAADDYYQQLNKLNESLRNADKSK